MMDNNTAATYINPLRADFTKWLPTNCLSVFDPFVRLALKGLIIWRELGPLCVMILLSTYGSGQQSNKIWVSAAHIPGPEKCCSRQKIQFEQSSKWKLRESVSKTIVSTFGKPDIDLFGSRINQLSNYISWRTDRGPRLLMHFP